MVMMYIIGFFVVYGLLIWGLKKLTWNMARKVEGRSKRILLRVFFVALIATPSVLPSQPSLVPIPALLMLCDGFITPIFEGTDDPLSYVLVRALLYGLAPICIATLVIFSICIVVLKSYNFVRRLT